MSLSYLPFISQIGFTNTLTISQITKVRDFIDHKEWQIPPLNHGEYYLKNLSLQDPWITQPPTQHHASIFLISHSMISSQGGIIHTQDGVIADTMYHTRSDLDHYQKNDSNEISLPAPTSSLTGRWLSMLLGNQDNYYHFLIMNIGRLFQLLPEDIHQIDGILLPKTLTSVEERTVQITIQQVFNNKNIQIKSVDWGETLSVQELLIPWDAVHIGNGYTHSGVIQFFHEFPKHIHLNGIDFPKYIYIDRRASKNRHLSNEDELIHILQNLNFAIVPLEQLTFDEQVLLFHHAEYIVAPHGAGLANLVFCQPHTKIVEIIPHTLLAFCYRQIAMISDLSYDCVMSYSFSKETNIPPTWADHQVNIQDVLNIINEHLPQL